MLPTPNTYPISETPLLGGGGYSHRLPHGVEIPNRVFVGGLAYDTTELELKNFFHQYGSVRDSKIITDRQGVSKGYGFVTFETAEEATKVQEQGCLYFNEKKLNVSKAIRKQGGQYRVPNQEYINGQRHWFDGMMVSDQECVWLMEQSSPNKPFGPMMFPPVFSPSGSQSSYHGNQPNPLFPLSHYYPPMYNGCYPTYLYNYNPHHNKDHLNNESLNLSTGVEVSLLDEQDRDLTELETLTQNMSIKDSESEHYGSGNGGKKRKPPRLWNPLQRPFTPRSPFHPQIMCGAPTYAPLLPTPHLIQPLPPRYLPKSQLN